MPSIEISHFAARHRRPHPVSAARLGDDHERLRRRLRWWFGDAEPARDVLHDLNARLLERRRLPQEAVLKRWCRRALRPAARLEAGSEGRASSGAASIPERRQVHA